MSPGEAARRVRGTAAGTGIAAGATAVLGIVPAALAFGVAFGVLARSAGMGILAPVVMSLTTFAGSAQFAAVSVLGVGGGVATAVAAALVLNARYAPIGLSVAPELSGPVWRRTLIAQLIVDESWAVSRHEGRYHAGRLVGAGLMLYAAWNLGTLLGVFGGALIGDPSRLGMDAAFAGLFLALLVPLLKTRPALAAASIGAAVAALLVPFTPPGVPIVAASVGVLAGWREER